tara:strand:+ start:308 stop:499 length:192 start_codon:yes stop_codon:yes gene_type:complete
MALLDVDRLNNYKVHKKGGLSKIWYRERKALSNQTQISVLCKELNRTRLSIRNLVEASFSMNN